MSKAEMHPIPDGRMRLLRILNESQKEALRSFKIEGLIILNLQEVNFKIAETWLEYWFDREIITEDELRSQLERTISSSK
jgi:predicted AAA+ superfamily ATPase